MARWSRGVPGTQFLGREAVRNSIHSRIGTLTSMHPGLPILLLVACCSQEEPWIYAQGRATRAICGSVWRIARHGLEVAIECHIRQ